ncbi:hypothetical protein [Clostridium felsineum]|uniref:Uncharacterized protein n=1 Tax=Clostridium felsineum TaxID=36839 RepID=A0A1S8LP38_9CLOT|nr:hypothetical protein [Clostridium felsineum]MCR3761293.1 hypothetical protein [Clostridium felsineum]URZ01515.1 hypothetical protein CLAUR_015100 [Clostridium felsineum]URZ05637.1 hypothetical protein CLROS_009630 [Clostridium felsineum]URZ10676.1 hypothetical protein CROST_013860 [Clostridium felsineum]URZ17409.1 hypothetical protein CLFE_034620 [Clostridium felsineum DSM 794]
MNRDEKAGVLLMIMIITGALIVNRTMNIHKDFKSLKKPTIENREVGDMGVYKWLTVRDLSKRYKVSEGEIFKILRIKNSKGDENIPIKDLLKKHKKTKTEVRDSLMEIIKKYGDRRDEKL